ncbi:MAG: hypothetical protein JWP89_4136 [Schlesneria sp.]|nr:hypothetical protein [Schlesneria sp.]
MSLIELLPALRPVVVQFDRLGIAYYIGGSVASSIYGEPRSTLDIDLGVDLSESAVHELATKWDGEFYVSESAMRTAAQSGRSFNLIHYATAMKIDIFVSKGDVFNTSVLKRRVTREVAFGDEALSVWFATPEDVVLHKLIWFRKGNETSERQWRDIAGILKAQQNRLDNTYIEEWADRLQIRDLWDRMRAELVTV